MPRDTSRLRPYCHFATRLWISTFVGFATGLVKEALDGLPNADEMWPWCRLENPCRFEGRAVLVYYESSVVAMILLICFSMTRAFLRDSRMRQPPPCDDTVAMSMDFEAEDIEEGQRVVDALDKSGDENGLTSTAESSGSSTGTEEETGTCSHVSTSESSTIASALGLSDSKEAAIGATVASDVDCLDDGPSKVLGTFDESAREDEQHEDQH